ncbi:MAG: TrkA C-terminal domain-containing protein [Phycisphaerae bacterium]|jgi:hypothetical protein
MNLLLFIIVLSVSFVIVRIGAIAFQLTGLDWELAKFQALSCFSGTGFTTKESELVVGNPQRRKIASVLMVLGNAGTVTLIATFANSLRPEAAGRKISLPFLKDFFPAEVLPWVNLAVIALFILILWRLFTYSFFARKITSILRKIVLKRQMVKAVTFEELLVATGGYGVSRITVNTNSSILNKSLNEARLRSHDITVLAIVRNNHTIPNPPADMTFMIDDELICFGRLENIQAKILAANS